MPAESIVLASGVIDAEADIEAIINLSPRQKDVLASHDKATLVIDVTETGTTSAQFDTLQGRLDGHSGTWTTIKGTIATTVDATGVSVIDVSNSTQGVRWDQIRVLVSSVTLDASNYWTGVVRVDVGN